MAMVCDLKFVSECSYDLSVFGEVVVGKGAFGKIEEKDVFFGFLWKQ